MKSTKGSSRPNRSFQTVADLVSLFAYGVVLIIFGCSLDLSSETDAFAFPGPQLTAEPVEQTIQPVIVQPVEQSTDQVKTGESYPEPIELAPEYTYTCSLPCFGPHEERLCSGLPVEGGVGDGFTPTCGVPAEVAFSFNASEGLTPIDACSIFLMVAESQGVLPVLCYGYGVTEGLSILENIPGHLRPDLMVASSGPATTLSESTSEGGATADLDSGGETASHALSPELAIQNFVCGLGPSPFVPAEMFVADAVKRAVCLLDPEEVLKSYQRYRAAISELAAIASAEGIITEEVTEEAVDFDGFVAFLEGEKEKTPEDLRCIVLAYEASTALTELCDKRTPAGCRGENPVSLEVGRNCVWSTDSSKCLPMGEYEIAGLYAAFQSKHRNDQTISICKQPEEWSKVADGTYKPLGCLSDASKCTRVEYYRKGHSNPNRLVPIFENIAAKVMVDLKNSLKQLVVNYGGCETFKNFSTKRADLEKIISDAAKAAGFLDDAKRTVSVQVSGNEYVSYFDTKEPPNLERDLLPTTIGLQGVVRQGGMSFKLETEDCKVFQEKDGNRVIWTRCSKEQADANVTRKCSYYSESTDERGISWYDYYEQTIRCEATSVRDGARWNKMGAPVRVRQSLMAYPAPTAQFAEAHVKEVKEVNFNKIYVLNTDKPTITGNGVPNTKLYLTVLDSSVPTNRDNTVRLTVMTKLDGTYEVKEELIAKGTPPYVLMIGADPGSRATLRFEIQK